MTVVCTLSMHYLARPCIKIAGLQNAAQNTSYQLLMCQVVLTKTLYKVLSEIELSGFQVFFF